jgi:hypothetical protein
MPTDADQMEKAFKAAWTAAEVAYRAGKINNEATLQALVFGELRGALATSKVLCEPRFDLGDDGRFVPDIVVLDGDEITAICELKFVPHRYPAYQPDLNKLKALSSSSRRHRCVLNPLDGEFGDQEHSVARTCLMVFGAIGRHDAKAVDAKTLSAFIAPHDARFLPLTLAIGSG